MGALRAVLAVREEVDRKNELYNWLNARNDLFVEHTEPIQRAAAEIANRFRSFARIDSTRPNADPYVIALARVESCTVVTQEQYNINRRPVKIPHVCEHYDIRCIDLFEFVNEQGWSF